MDALDRIVNECSDQPKMALSPSIIDTLKRKKARMETDLANVNAALEALEKNPEVANVLELVCRAR